jgi:G3E family GTPase
MGGDRVSGGVARRTGYNRSADSGHRGYRIPAVGEDHPDQPDFERAARPEDRRHRQRVREDRPIDINRFMGWMSPILMERGEDIYRSKGIFHAQGFKERLIFQSVRMLTTMRPERPWKPDEKRQTEFVVIGRDLDREEFAESFAECVAGGG